MSWIRVVVKVYLIYQVVEYIVGKLDLKEELAKMNTYDNDD